MSCNYENDPDIYDAYLLGELSSREAEEFEKHFFDCEECAREIALRGEIVGQIKAQGEEIFPEFVGEVQAEKEEVTPPSKGFFNGIFQPFLKPRLAAATILVLLVIAILPWTFQILKERPGIGPVQTIHLLPERSPEKDSFKIGLGYDGLLRFVFRDAVAGESYQVVIESEDGTVIFEDHEFRGFDEHETGRLFLPLEKVEPGNYRLVIEDPRAEPPLNKQEYSFRIEE